MIFCPQCGIEYIAESKNCPDCDIPLVEITDEFDLNGDEWVPLHNLPGRVYAEMVQEVLEQRNIPSYIQSDLITGVYGVTGISTVGSKCVLFVPKDLKQLAQNILHQMVDHI